MTLENPVLNILHSMMFDRKLTLGMFPTKKHDDN